MQQHLPSCSHMQRTRTDSASTVNSADRKNTLLRQLGRQHLGAGCITEQIFRDLQVTVSGEYHNGHDDHTTQALLSQLEDIEKNI